MVGFNIYVHSTIEDKTMKNTTVRISLADFEKFNDFACIEVPAPVGQNLRPDDSLSWELDERHNGQARVVEVKEGTPRQMVICKVSNN
jgi:hypothetical protein